MCLFFFIFRIPGAISLLLRYSQYLLAQYVFLLDKLSKSDPDKPLAITNRHVRRQLNASKIMVECACLSLESYHKMYMYIHASCHIHVRHHKNIFHFMIQYSSFIVHQTSIETPAILMHNKWRILYNDAIIRLCDNAIMWACFFFVDDFITSWIISFFWRTSKSVSSRVYFALSTALSGVCSIWVASIDASWCPAKNRMTKVRHTDKICYPSASVSADFLQW